VMRFGLSWPKQPDQLVKKVQITLFFNFLLNGGSYFGSATGSVQGYNLGEVSMAGQLATMQGEGALNMSEACSIINMQLSYF
jgi:hypothetical protein